MHPAVPFIASSTLAFILMVVGLAVPAGSREAKVQELRVGFKVSAFTMRLWVHGGSASFDESGGMYPIFLNHLGCIGVGIQILAVQLLGGAAAFGTLMIYGGSVKAYKLYHTQWVPKFRCVAIIVAVVAIGVGATLLAFLKRFPFCQVDVAELASAGSICSASGCDSTFRGADDDYFRGLAWFNIYMTWTEMNIGFASIAMILAGVFLLMGVVCSVFVATDVADEVMSLPSAPSDGEGHNDEDMATVDSSGKEA